MQLYPSGARRELDDRHDVDWAVARLADGVPVAHGFGNFYALTARGDRETVQRVNAMKGRPLDQTGSITAPPARIADAFDWTALPDALDRDLVQAVFDAFFALGPFGFRGPAAPGVGPHLTSRDGDVLTAQVIAPGYTCPSNRFLAAAAGAVGDDLLYITSANRSRQLTGAADEPAHWRASELRAEFADAIESGTLVLLEHADEQAAHDRSPAHLPMSTTILGFHRAPVMDGRAHLTLERHGSLGVGGVRAVLDRFGLGVRIAPAARTRLTLRRYADETRSACRR